MGLVTRWLNHGQQEKHASADYIDLSDYAAGASDAGAASTFIRVAEIHKYDDLKEFAGHVYDGNILILDFSKVAADDILLKRVSNDLRKLAADVNGDIAGLSDSLIVVTPTGTKIDRRKVRRTDSS